MKTALATALFALLMLLPPSARALCVSPLCSCSVTTSPLVFGAHQPIAGTATESTGNVRVACGGVVGVLIPYTVELSAGGGGSVAARSLARAGGGTLAYQLYSNAGRTTVWGDATGGSPLGGSMLLDVAGLSPPVNHTVYGRIPAGQTSAVPGVYTDTLTVTLTYY